MSFVPTQRPKQIDKYEDLVNSIQQAKLSISQVSIFIVAKQPTISIPQLLGKPMNI